jgi:hypothetical protein
MTLETLNSVASVGTFIVIALTALAALVQLRHLRHGNWLAAQLTILEMWQSDKVQGPYDYIKAELGERLKDPQYRHELEYGPLNRSKHPEMYMIDWNSQLGLIVSEGLLDDHFLQLYSPAIDTSWQKLEPVVALLRRQRGNDQFVHFEYLVSRMRQLQARRNKSIFSGAAPRISINDPWLASDHPEHSG